MSTRLPKSVDVIVHIGAGRCEELDAYLSSSATRIILVEPRAPLAVELRMRSAMDSRVQVLEVAVTNNPQYNKLNEYSIPGADSLYLPSGLKKLFPGLRLLAQHPVDTITVPGLLKLCAFTGDQNALIVQAPGLEVSIIESFSEAGALEALSYISVICPEQPLYDLSGEPERILSLLHDERFDLVRRDGTDPDWPTYSFRRNSLKQKLAVLTASLRVEKEKNIELKKALESRAETNSEAGIGEFLKDIEPFFYNKNITYVDVGAFIGEVFFEVRRSKRLKIREAHLYEPNPDSFKTLTDNLRNVKSMPALHAYNCGLGNEKGTKTFIAAKPMTKVLADSAVADSTTGTFRCEIVTLDSQIKNITDGHINLLKVDVEGYEAQVLRGAEEAIKRQSIDLIYLEVGLNVAGTQQTYFGSLDQLLQGYGYRVFKIYEQKNEWVSDSPFLRRCNVAYMSEKFANKNPSSLVKEIFELTKA